ncbi:MAG: hypothetical protein SGI91_08870 [Alphaproteobacteria bacterium]|jgi:hypothetical protein|nr:hypothetical protein [Alphaproteobacteria bacterium]
MAVALKAGVLYFAIVFAAGFALGALRVMVIAPRLGETGAVLLELPVMLTLSWFVCAWLVRLQGVSAAAVPRIVMGAAAFVLLMAAEAGVSVFAFGRSPAEHFEAYRAATAQIGLAAQVAFLAFPLLQAWLRRV